MRMRSFIPKIVIAVVFSIIGYFLGAYVSMFHAIRGLGLSKLSLLTGIHQKVAAGQYSDASSMIETAVDSQVAVLSAVENHPDYVLRQILPWKPDPMKRLDPRFLQQAKEHFSQNPEILKPETRAYLNSRP